MADATTAPTREAPTMPVATLRILADKYGPHAFGLVAVMILWVTVVQPEMRRGRADMDRVAAIAETQQRTAVILEQTVQRLERIADKLERRTP